MKKTSKQIKLLLLNSCLKTGRLLIICLFLFKNNVAQNLINNGNFESYSVNANGCAFNFPMVNIWQQINSPDHYTTSCTFTNSYGVPNNTAGVSYPKSGNAYIGIVCFYKAQENKEYIYQNLTNSLIAGKTYYTSFFVSKADRTIYTIKNIGANFSVTQPTVISIPYINATPQVVNQSGFLTDTINWVKIEGYFTAQGGEQYITIGNFNSNANTDTLNSGTTNPIPFDNGTAYYYIDSVSLYDSLDYVTNIKNHENDFKVNLYPNPNNGTFTLSYNLAKDVTEADVIITDVTGKLMYQDKLDIENHTINLKLQNAQSGIYFVKVMNGKLIISVDKVIINN